MTDRKLNLVIGSLLHDIGKVIYREERDGRTYSASGYDYLKEETNLGEEILDCVGFHHPIALAKAQLSDDHLAYIVSAASRMAAFADRRQEEQQEEGSFAVAGPLRSVFNILNGNSQDFYYTPEVMGKTDEGINYPSGEKRSFSKDFYREVQQNLTEKLSDVRYDTEYVNDLLAVLEEHLSYVPSATEEEGAADISWYDHTKLTAAMAACLYDYLNANHMSYKETLFLNRDADNLEAFLLCAMDTSGIQNFIYTITSKHALKSLRARSFYLEVMMEHNIDVLLNRLQLTRANLLYSGGGNCYLLLPNTEETKDCLEAFQQELKRWYMEHFQIDLYMAYGYVPCSGNALRDVPKGSYSNLFHSLSKMVSKRKQQRYTGEDILWLNHQQAEDYTRECKICKRIGHVNKEGICPLCKSIESLSADVLYQDFFSVLSGDEGSREGSVVPLPGGYRLVAENEASLEKRMASDPDFVRAYGKNRRYRGKRNVTKLWVGDYAIPRASFQDLAESSKGIQRIGVLRADVDNMGQAFVSGFNDERNGNRYVSLTRTATLSRHLSIFFKYYIRDILRIGEYALEGGKRNQPRQATVVYSGGDDMFIVGAWNDVIELAVDLRRKFRRYTQGTMSLSGGIGVYDSSYPIIAIAEETGEMESASKSLPEKNGITLLEDGCTHEMEGYDGAVSDGTYSWDELERDVIQEKFQILRAFFETTDEQGMAFLYRILELIRNRKEKINFARLVYMIARLEPVDKDSKEQKEVYQKQKKAYRNFSEHMVQWMQSEKDCRQLKTAIQLYVYLNRNGEEEHSEN